MEPVGCWFITNIVEECNQRYTRGRTYPESDRGNTGTRIRPAPRTVGQAEQAEEEMKLARGKSQRIQGENEVEDIQLLGQNYEPPVFLSSRFARKDTTFSTGDLFSLGVTRIYTVPGIKIR